MPVNFQQIYTRIKEIAQGAHDNKRVLEERRILARELLAVYASELDYLREKVEKAKETDINLRVAVPFKESLAACFPPPVIAAEATIIAADGSQVNPDRHASVQFCIINVGVIAMRLGRKLQWDPAKEQFVGDAQANQWLRREMRKPWTLETV